jgi:hypothetical protein
LPVSLLHSALYYITRIDSSETEVKFRHLGYEEDIFPDSGIIAKKKYNLPQRLVGRVDSGISSSVGCFSERRSSSLSLLKLLSFIR